MANGLGHGEWRHHLELRGQPREQLAHALGVGRRLAALAIVKEQQHLVRARGGPAQGLNPLRQRAVVVVVAAIALLAPAAATASTARASASPARSTAQAVSAGIRVTATIPVGDQPVGVTANPRTNTIYIAHQGAGLVSVRAGSARGGGSRPVSFAA